MEKNTFQRKVGHLNRMFPKFPNRSDCIMGEATAPNIP